MENVFNAYCDVGNLREEMPKYISLDQLPALYGGDRYEPDAECSDYIQHGGDVDPKYYLTNRMETSREEMERVVVGRGSSHKVRHEVAEVGSTLQWEFCSTDYDISFELSLVTTKAEDHSEKKDRQILVRRHFLQTNSKQISNAHAMGGRDVLLLEASSLCLLSTLRGCSYIMWSGQSLWLP